MTPERFADRYRAERPAPVAPPDTLEDLPGRATDLIGVRTPEHLTAVGLS